MRVDKQNRNFSCPRFDEIVADYSGAEDWPIHAKDVSTLSLDAMDSIVKSRDKSLRERWEEAKRWLNDPKMYENTRALKEDRLKSICGLSEEHREKLIALGHWKDFKGHPKGYVRVFLVPEPWKSRWRVISHTMSVNRDVDRVPGVSLPSLNDVRSSIFKGPCAACLDMAQCFCQFELGELVRSYFVITTNHGYFSLGRLAMGQRQSCFIAQTALEILVGESSDRVSKLSYIDNAKLTGDKKNIVKELRSFRDRTIEAGATFTELKDDKPLEQLVSDTVEYLGLRLDHTNKKIQLVDKVIEKLKLSISKVSTWTIRQWSNHVSILLYTYYALRYKLGRFEQILKVWARVQSRAYLDPHIWDTSASSLPSLCDWTSERILNPWVDVRVDEKPSFTLITDASSSGWCGILISNTSGEHHQERFLHS